MRIYFYDGPADCNLSVNCHESTIMKHVVRHDVSQEQAQQAIDTAIQVYSRKFQKYGANTRWQGSRGEISVRVAGRSLLATVEIFPERIEMAMDVPFIFLPFKTQALKLLESEIRKWLARAKAGELRTV